MTPLLTVYTPAYRRPRALEWCRSSVAAQGPDVQHLIVHDYAAAGVEGVFRLVPHYAGAARGQYVYWLCDDDAMEPGAVDALRGFVEAEGYPDVVMCRMRIAGGLYPTNWGGPPVQGHIGIGCYVVSNAVWRRHARAWAPNGGRYEGDYDFIRDVWAGGYRVAWLDRVLSRTQNGWSRGRPEV